MVSSGERYLKYLIGFKDNDYKIKLLCIMFPKTSAYLKSYDDETKWMNFLIKDDDLLKKKIKIFRIKSLTILKKNLIANPSKIIFFWKPR